MRKTYIVPFDRTPSWVFTSVLEKNKAGSGKAAGTTYIWKESVICINVGKDGVLTKDCWGSS